MLDERGLLPQCTISLLSKMYGAGRVPITTRLVNGRGVEYFKQPFTLLLFSLLTSLSLPLFFFLFTCALVKCTHDPVSATAVHVWNLHDIMLYFWDQWDEWRYSESPHCGTDLLAGCSNCLLARELFTYRCITASCNF